MSQTRFYVAESRAVVPRVSLFVGGLPPDLSPQEYDSLLDEFVATKGVTTCAGLGLLATGYQGWGRSPVSSLWGLLGRPGPPATPYHWFLTQWVSPRLWGPDRDTASEGLLSRLLCLEPGHGHPWGGRPCRVV